jgi:hypothetical protein
MKTCINLKDGRLWSPELPTGFYSIGNNLRTIRHGTRQSYEVVRTIPGNFPYDPQPFPKGSWSITGVEWQKDFKFDINTYGPVKIKTDAWQMVNVWELDEEGDYLRQTDVRVKDTCYWLHYSVSNTTLGCIRFASPEDAIVVAERVVLALGRGEAVSLEVG